MSASLSERNMNRNMTSTDANGKSSCQKGKLATSLDEMLGEKFKKLSLAGSGRIKLGKLGSDSAKSKSSPSSKGSKGSKGSNRTHRGRSGSPGFVTVDGITPLKVESAIKAECVVVAKNDSSVKIETPADSEHEIEVKEESPSVSDHNIKEDSLFVSDHDRKEDNPAGSDSRVLIKEESPALSGLDAVASNDSPVGSDHGIEIKDEIPVVSDSGVTIKAEDEFPERYYSDMKTETSISDDSEPEIKVEHEEAPAVGLPPTVRVMTYHRNADIYVHVRNNTKIGYGYYRVCKDIVSCASDVLEEKFKTRITRFSMNVSNTAGVRYIVPMMDEDDSPVGLNIIFSLLHNKYHELPSRPSIDELYGLAQVVEKYKLPQLLVPFTDKWLVQDLNYNIIMAGDKFDNERVMLLTWIFGEGRWFSRVLPKVARDATMSQDGTLMGAGGPFAGKIPAQLVAVMTKYRYDCLKKLKQSIHQPLQDLIKGSRVYCRSKGATPDIKESCNLQQLGGMITGLTAAGLIPFPNPETYKGSVMDMVKKLEMIRSVRYKIPGVSPHLDTHQSCGIRHVDAVKSVVADPIRLTPELYNEFRRRGEKTGIYSEELYNELKAADADDLVRAMPEFKTDVDHFVQECWEEAREDE